MNYGMVLAATAVMALVTYLPRMLPMAVIKRKIQNRFIRSFLTYVPYAVLSAMTFPAILYSTSDNLAVGVPSAAAGLLVNARHIPFGVTVRDLVSGLREVSRILEKGGKQ